jgi:site-specific DNA-cytosine methylase
MPKRPVVTSKKKARKKPGRMKVVGVTCGIGSMLHAATRAGFKTVGNIEWRKYYHALNEEGDSTFRHNYKGAYMVHRVEDLSPEQLQLSTGCELAMGHPECGNFSQLGGVNKGRVEKLKDAADIPLFVELIAKLKPRFFVMDDLPKSLGAFTMADYAAILPDYDLYPEWVSNWGYGNVQKYRNRMFMIGSRREEGWAFQPGEIEPHEISDQSLRSAIEDLIEYIDLPNHDPIAMEELAQKNLSMRFIDDRPTWTEVGEFAKENWPGGACMTYHARDGSIKKKPGCKTEYWDGPASVQDGGSYKIHPTEYRPLNIRERARIQGFSDDFVFIGTKLNEAGEYNPDRNGHVIKQTGKAMPIQFCMYIAKQVRAAILDRPFRGSGDRILKPNDFVNEAKQWYCHEVGYSNKEKACDCCWMRSKCTVLNPQLAVPSLPETPEAAPEDAGAPPSQEPTRKKGKLRRPKGKLRRPKGKRLGRKKTRRSKKSGPSLGPVTSNAIPYEIFDRPDESKDDLIVERVGLIEGRIPEDYYCRCKYCTQVIGELKRSDGSFYSRLDRRGYYDKIEQGGKGHAAKTPLHLARWAVQEFTKPGDWVLDPTVGAGTTAVEALIQDRNAAGVEIQYHDIIRANVYKHAIAGNRAVIGFGDARGINTLLDPMRQAGVKFKLVVNNPPYFGDQHWTTLNVPEGSKNQSTTFKYNQDLPNLALLKEGDEYWRTLSRIYSMCTASLAIGGRFVIGVKDQMRNKKPDLLHAKIAQVLNEIEGLEYEGAAFLKHYPGTLHLHTYYKRYGVHPPYFQSIMVFKKVGE